MKDLGLVEVRVDLEKAKRSSFGAFLLRPFDLGEVVKVRPSLMADEKIIACGSKVKKGFWIFAMKVKADGTPIDSISLCVLNPRGDTSCAEDKEFELAARMSTYGTFKFSLWDNLGRKTDCLAIAE
jgi:hypothetical protein